jgi:2-hydroxychromene-2-carboxylate isomerase
LYDLVTLRQIADECGLAGEHLATKIEQPAIKASLKAATDQAIKLGIFGVPMWVLNGELFWGDDRLEDALHRAAQAG